MPSVSSSLSNTITSAFDHGDEDDDVDDVDDVVSVLTKRDLFDTTSFASSRSTSRLNIVSIIKFSKLVNKNKTHLLSGTLSVGTFKGAPKTRVRFDTRTGVTLWPDILKAPTPH